MSHLHSNIEGEKYRVLSPFGRERQVSLYLCGRTGYFYQGSLSLLIPSHEFFLRDSRWHICLHKENATSKACGSLACTVASVTWDVLLLQTLFLLHTLPHTWKSQGCHLFECALVSASLWIFETEIFFCAMINSTLPHDICLTVSTLF